MPKRQKPDIEQIRRVAREKFGFETLRPGQEEAILSILSGRDTLVVKPTGSGKSAIYQIAGLLLDGPTVIVSPLIALQRDQVHSINSNDVPEAALVNSTQRVGELRRTFEKLEGGEVEFLFLSPEQFSNDETRERVFASKPSLFVVDEAHCISEWGHDFRPDYMKLGAAIEALGRPVTLAMTATASPTVRDEIAARLSMKDPKIIVKGYDRPNIWLGTQQFPSEQAKLDALIDRVSDEEKPGIVYVATRKNAELIGEALSERGLRVVYYHGGMPAKERDAVQSDYMSGAADIIVATNAFGMGIDKPNVRFVFHADISDSLDSYYQEIGRAGRDNKPAKAVLFYRPENLNVQKFLKGGGKLDQTKLQQVAELVHREGGPVELEAIAEQVGISERKAAKAINRLEEAGALELLPTGEVSPSENAGDLTDAAAAAAAEQTKRKDSELLRLEKMRAYAEMTSCRREYLLNYFGDDPPQKCGHCDNCDTPREESKPLVAAGASSVTRSDEPYVEKSRVTHREWGKGIVESQDGDKITILFDGVGRKTLSAQFVADHQLLAPVA